MVSDLLNILTVQTRSLKHDRKELIFLQSKLKQLLEPINDNNWQALIWFLN